MSDQILYTGGPNPFKGLIGMPEEPKVVDRIQEEGQRPFIVVGAQEEYNKQVESIKSNAPDIVSSECTFYHLQNNKMYVFSGDNINPIEVKPGDIFDLPVGYKFKKEEQCAHDSCPVDGGCERCKEPKTVLRIVKTESGLRNGLNEPVETQEQPDSLVKTNIYEPIIDAVNDPHTLICPSCGEILPRNFGLPEPEESQKELWAEIIRESRFHDGTPSDLMAFTDHFSRLFTIQRKK